MVVVRHHMRCIRYRTLAHHRCCQPRHYLFHIALGIVEVFCIGLTPVLFLLRHIVHTVPAVVPGITAPPGIRTRHIHRRCLHLLQRPVSTAVIPIHRLRRFPRFHRMAHTFLLPVGIIRIAGRMPLIIRLAHHSPQRVIRLLRTVPHRICLFDHTHRIVVLILHTWSVSSLIVLRVFHAQQIPVWTIFICRFVLG